MSSANTQRRLAAILAADVVGYSRLMGQDEAGTLAALKALRTKIIDPKVAEHSGRIFKSTGDGLLAEFPSVVNAVSCAVEIQRGMQVRNNDLPEERAIRLRIGINLGDVIVEGDDLFGDGVNVAARIESIAPPDGVAVSGTVRDHLGTRLDIHFKDIGEQVLKNIDRPIRVYLLDGETRSARSYPTLPDKPSIAVLPFQNMSGDREQEYFADGVVEEIITALSRFRQLFVIARNSSFTYKDRAVDIKQVGRELGVRYVLEGSVRRAGNKVRITGQLIDTATGAHLWADRFDGELEDIFDLQERVTVSVVGAIAPKVEQVELQRSKRKPTESLDAYDYYLRGLSAVHEWTREGNTEAISHFGRAMDLDPNFAAAYGFAARCYSQRKAGGWSTDPTREISEADRLARKAAELGWDDAVALCTAGVALAFVVGDLKSAMTFTDRAVVLNPNLAMAWLFNGWVKLWSGQADEAIICLTQALRLSPNAPQKFSMHDAMAAAQFVAGHFSDAFEWSSAALREKPDFTLGLCMAAASAALCGHSKEAEEAIARLRRLEPSWRIANVQEKFPELPLTRPDQFARFADGLRKAGLPD